jgi:hypothetical protein
MILNFNAKKRNIWQINTSFLKKIKVAKQRGKMLYLHNK